MLCELCSHSDTAVVDSRLTESNNTVRRRRECKKCGYRFTTYERSTNRMENLRRVVFTAEILSGQLTTFITETALKLLQQEDPAA